YELLQDSTKSFIDILNYPNIFQYDTKLCCQTCGDDELRPYVLSGNFDESKSESFFSIFNNLDTKSFLCCLNGYVVTEIYELLKEKTEEAELKLSFCCTPTDFKKTLIDLKKLLNSSEFDNYLLNGDELLTGLIEWNTINGDTQLKHILEYFKNESNEKALEYIFDILNNGLVIACLNDGVVITSIETYVTNFV
ncbi:MAG: hypothetical protein ACK518_01940, partial [bacterium]